MTAATGLMTTMAERAPFPVSWQLRDLRTGATAGGEEHRTVPEAGTLRLLLYLACLRAAAKNALDLDTPLRYEERHRQGHDAGILRWMTPGLTVSLGDALAQLIITADGVADALVREHLDGGPRSATDLMDGLCERADLTATRPADGVTSAADQVALVTSLVTTATGGTPARDLGLSAELASTALQVMASVLRTDGIAGRLPGHGPFLAEVAHLTCDGGTGDRFAAHWGDVGVAYQHGAPSYALAVFCTNVPEMVDGRPGRVHAVETIGAMSAVYWDHAA